MTKKYGPVIGGALAAGAKVGLERARSIKSDAMDDLIKGIWTTKAADEAGMGPHAAAIRALRERFHAGGDPTLLSDLDALRRKMFDAAPRFKTLEHPAFRAATGLARRTAYRQSIPRPYEQVLPQPNMPTVQLAALLQDPPKLDDSFAERMRNRMLRIAMLYSKDGVKRAQRPRASQATEFGSQELVWLQPITKAKASADGVKQARPGAAIRSRQKEEGLAHSHHLEERQEDLRHRALRLAQAGDRPKAIVSFSTGEWIP